MNFKNLLIIGLANLFVLSCFSQVEFANNEDLNYRRKKRIQAVQHINELKSSVVLVRLSTQEKTIAALKRVGNEDLANRKIAETKAFNEAVVTAFKENFTFCPTYFFYSNQSRKILNKDLKNVEFLNENLEHDPNISFDADIFYTSEFAFSNHDTTIIETGFKREKRDGKYETIHRQTRESDIHIFGVSIKSDLFIPILIPFPQQINCDKEAKAVAMAVNKLNTKLYAFLEGKSKRIAYKEQNRSEKIAAKKEAKLLRQERKIEKERLKSSEE